MDRTRRAALGRLASLLGKNEIGAALWESLEASLIQADVGVGLAREILHELKATAAQQGFTRADELRQVLHEKLVSLLILPPADEPVTKPLVYVLVGVNGSGKTTTAAKLAARLQRQGRQVILAAADTYRAAADEQLIQWATRLGLEVVSGKPGSDPGAVTYDAAQAALARQADTLIVDTSGRMHTSHNLMAELQKVCRVTGKVVPGAPHRVFLVLDATTGQNGLAQAKAFTQAVGVTDVILAKLDSSARGGIALAVCRDLKIPVAYAGLGEAAEDLAPFDPAAFVDALLADLPTPSDSTSG